MRDEFHDQLVAVLPRLRGQARALTHNRADAEDLVQDAVLNALHARDSFAPGTNFRAWMHRIVRNRFLSVVRQEHQTVEFDDLSLALGTFPSQEDRLTLKALPRALGCLPAIQREALIMVLQGMTYDAVAEATDCALGTAKTRVFRARQNLRAWLLGDRSAKAAATSVARQH